MVSYRKLVRDRIPEILDEKGVPHEVQVVEGEEFRVELVKKLFEEVEEFIEAQTLEELADVLEVVDALKQLPEYADVHAEQERKRVEKGAFTNRYVVSGEK